MKERKVYYDGLRTLFCLIVVSSHFCLTFFPDCRTAIWNDGNLGVMYFLVLAGGVTALSAKRFKEGISVKEIVGYISKRYLRLLPIIALSIMFGFLIQIGGYCNSIAAEQMGNDRLGAYFSEYISFPVAVWDAFIGSFYRRPELNTPLWTIKYEFLGVIMDYIIVRLTPEKRKKLIYPVVGMLLYVITHDIYFVAIFAGAVMFEWLFSPAFKHVYSKKAAICLRVIVSFLTIAVAIGIYAVYARLMLVIALCAIMAEDKSLQQIFSNKYLLRLSEYTFAVYAVHWPIICSLSCYIYLSNPSNYMKVISCIVSLPIIAIAGYILEFVNRSIINVTTREK